MTQSFRGFVFLLRPVALAMLVLCAGCFKSCQKNRELSSDLEIAHKETKFVFKLDLTKPNETSIGRHLVESVKKNAEATANYHDFLKKCGDPFQKIESVFVALPEDVSKQDQILITVRGIFTEQDVVSCVESTRNIKQIATLSSGVNMYPLRGNFFFALPTSKNFLVIAPKQRLEQIIAKKIPIEASAQANPELVEGVKTAFRSDAFLWGVGLVTNLMNIKQRVKDLSGINQDPSVDQVALFFSAKQTLKFSLQVTLKTPEDAIAVGTSLQNRLKEFSMSPQAQQFDIESLNEWVHVTPQDKAVLIDVDIKPAQIDELVGKISAGMHALSKTL